MNIFSKTNYRVILRSLLLGRRKNFGLSAFSFQKMAAACRIQKAYLSSVLNQKAHFNSDQIFLACQFLSLKANEHEYIDLLQNYERSVSPKRKLMLQQKIEHARRVGLSTEENIIVAKEGDRFTDVQRNRYFLNPDIQLVHMFLTVPAYLSNHEKIAKTLNFSKKRMDFIMNELYSMGIISIEKRETVVLKDIFHLAQDSEIFQSYRTNLRLKALSHLSTSEDPDKYSLSVVFSCDEATHLSIKRRFLEFLSTIQEDVTKIRPTQVYQMNFDLFSWSK